MASGDRPRNIGGWLSGPHWVDLQARLKQQGDLLETLRQALPPELASHCRHCVPKAERLLVYVDSPALAFQVRFFGPSLLDAVALATGRRFRHLQVRQLWSGPSAAGPAGAQEPTGESAPRPPSASLEEALERLAATVARRARPATYSRCTD